MHHLVILFFHALFLGATGFATECWHCFSEADGNCENPYQGRYGPNSTILKPDCSQHMARAYHASVIYILSTASRITEIGANDTRKWLGMGSAPKRSYECCKSVMDVVTFDGAPKTFVARGCCFAPAIYNQCRDIANLCREMTLTTAGPNGTINRSTCKVAHCSTCSTNSCNTSGIVESNSISTGVVILLSIGMLIS